MKDIEQKLIVVEQLELDYGFHGVSFCSEDGIRISTKDSIDSVIAFLQRSVDAIGDLAEE